MFNTWPCALLYQICSYARDDTTVELSGMSLFDNTGARGSVIFMVNSDLKTNKVRTKLVLRRHVISPIKSTGRAAARFADIFCGLCILLYLSICSSRSLSCPQGISPFLVAN